MKRRSFLAWCGATGFLAFLGRLFAPPRKPALKGWYFEEIEGFVIVNRQSLKRLPKIIDTDHPESLHIEVLDAKGAPIGRVRAVDTKLMMAKQYVGQPIPEEERFAHATRLGARQPPPAWRFDVDPSTGQIQMQWVPYARLRMRDGRDVLEVLGV